MGFVWTKAFADWEFLGVEVLIKTREKKKEEKGTEEREQGSHWGTVDVRTRDVVFIRDEERSLCGRRLQFFT